MLRAPRAGSPAFVSVFVFVLIFGFSNFLLLYVYVLIFNRPVDIFAICWLSEVFAERPTMALTGPNLPYLSYPVRTCPNLV